MYTHHYLKLTPELGQAASLRFHQRFASLLVPDLDSVVRFEGEITLVELVDAISAGKDWHSIQGIAYCGQDEVVATPARSLVKDLDQLP